MQLLASFGRLFPQVFQKPQQCQPLTFDTDDSRRGAGQLPQDFAKFFSGGYHATPCGAGDATKSGDKRLKKYANLAAAAAPCSSLNFAHTSRSDY